MSMIGVILPLACAKNAILLIDFAKWSEDKGMERREALIEAGRVRLRPILMTTFALVAGMIPVALGSGEGGDFRAPLGITVIGGVITSTLLTLLVIPTVYEVLADSRDWLGAKLTRRAPRHAAPLDAGVAVKPTRQGRAKSRLMKPRLVRFVVFWRARARGPGLTTVSRWPEPHNGPRLSIATDAQPVPETLEGWSLLHLIPT
jgi:predicted RND superfamily exporter protein